jgi:hypothetical protein
LRQLSAGWAALGLPVRSSGEHDVMRAHIRKTGRNLITAGEDS